MSRIGRLQSKVSRYLTRQDNSGNRPHTLYILSPKTLQQDSNGLPLAGAGSPVKVTPTPFVALGAKEIQGESGALELVGDAHVEHLDRSAYTRDSLFGALFFIDNPAGEQYELIGNTLQEVGGATWSFALKRMSQ